MPTKGGPPTTSTAQSPQPSRSISAVKRSTMASLSVRVGDDPSDSTTDGWVFSSKNGSRSTSVNGRSTSRDVATDGSAGAVPEVVATTLSRRP